ncbi:MAG: hypothetical protein JNM24_04765 [Bdellovibrionaceae bacterium]|nr:hypothetical protein [Pseudobdellovibrionaceae bacterium]
MALKTFEVYKCLERKTLILGFEILDLFVCFLLLAVLSMIFKEFSYKFFITWGPAALLAIILRVGKSGKPDNFLLHWVRFQFLPGIISAFPMATPKRKRVVKL